MNILDLLGTGINNAKNAVCDVAGKGVGAVADVGKKVCHGAGDGVAKAADAAGGIVHNVLNHGPGAVVDAAKQAGAAALGIPQAMGKGAAEFSLAKVLRTVIPNRDRPDHPDWPGAVQWEGRSSDEQLVRGWACPGTQSKAGTVFLLHGFTEHCMSGQVMSVASRIRERHGHALVALDTRHHGRSGNRAPTFGTAEMWDLQAAMNWAEASGFPRPFVLCGYSLGAMAANRTAISDLRVLGAFLQSMPECPMDAIGVAVQPAVVAAAPTIHAAYDCRGILGDGDIRHHNGTPDHAPLICMAMGDQDHFGIEKTKGTYRHWYGDQRGGFERWPGQDSSDCKWFVTFAGANHGLNQHSHPRLGELLDAFLNQALNR